MKFIKIILVIIVILLVVTLGFGAYLWSKLQTLKAGFGAPSGSVESSVPVGEGTSTGSSAEPITVDVSSLSESQQKVLKTLGFEASSYTITPQMRVCAEEKLGAARVAEIAGGASVGMFEAMTLAACVKN